jgi:hypothetical protein
VEDKQASGPSQLPTQTSTESKAVLQTPQGGHSKIDTFTKLMLMFQFFLRLNQESPAILDYPGTAPNGLDEDHMLHLGMLDAISTIFVQDYKVVAVSFASSKVTVMVQDSDVISLNIPVDYQTMPGCKALFPSKVAMIANPKFSANCIIKPSAITHKLQVLDKGNNLWPLVLKFDWHCAMM